MSYTTIAQMKDDTALRKRINACAANEGIQEPETWVNVHAWEFATQPGWAAAWDSAVETGIENPGRMETVISDAQILSAVQAINS